MTTHSQLNGSGVALRVLAVSLACATLFLLDRIIPPLLGSEPSPFQDATLYLWLLILRVFGDIPGISWLEWISWKRLFRKGADCLT
ncbi:MAG: hypothetical protein V9H26_22940 [Verrucomicrobiota bacterium]|nr:hypothetical protein [Limisphaerales bacterium]